MCLSLFGVLFVVGCRCLMFVVYCVSVVLDWRLFLFVVCVCVCSSFVVCRWLFVVCLLRCVVVG